MLKSFADKWTIRQSKNYMPPNYQCSGLKTIENVAGKGGKADKH